ncbi:uncharacterized protein BT62DRAFT_1008579 [Guyanagaster necrorhizus]|uniref:Uncharacterized protein n=1 Tax=Guyanagaster necrorhizus TaxID=856835 RepID=A0A9P7VNI7_9AGAR|nr:uncharacterized protein BT62DRAFT_1008579 [Guyanagaster necrorhizus MCA 3950]KAG7443897.1 hypothetical protein BT62DRAFT_1008579 [Guyanagaster necrorhizus MCA 3950]
MAILHLTIFVLFINLLVVGELTNHTIDDTLGDQLTGFQVDYSPASNAGAPVWKNTSQCNNCAIVPSPSLAMYNTWTSATYYAALGNVTAQMIFHGSAIYIYLILSNYPKSTGLVSDVLCDFRIDGEVAGNFRHDTDGTYQFEYDVLAYGNVSLVDDDHTFLIEISGLEPSYVIFDYAVYTNTQVSITFPAAESSTSTTARNPATTSLFVSTVGPSPSFPASSSFRQPFKGAIAGITVGVSVFIALIASSFLYFRRRHQNSSPPAK